MAGSTGRFRRHLVRLPAPQQHRDPLIEPGLSKWLASLPDRQRVAVLLVHAFGYTVREAAETLGVSASTVQQNANRGLTRLRAQMGVTSSV
jgi:RNA polymerase sigma factor (sigma-70 family)